jgi:transcriptional regulator with XRE-family HTH domain
MSTSTRPASCDGLFRKGTRIHLGIQEPVDLTAGRLSDPRQHLGARPMLSLLELDQMRPACALRQLCQPVMRQVRFAARPSDSRCYERPRRLPDPLLKFVPRRIQDVAILRHVARRVKKATLAGKRHVAHTCAVTMQGETLRLLRRRAGLTQAQLAEKAGYPRERISGWESPNARHGIHDDNARVLAKALDADENALTKQLVQETLAQEVRRLSDDHEARLRALEAMVETFAKAEDVQVGLERLRESIEAEANERTRAGTTRKN